MATPAQMRKALATLVVGILGWATAVTVSDPAEITSSEWIVLAGVFVALVVTYLVPNEPVE